MIQNTELHIDGFKLFPLSPILEELCIIIRNLG